MEGSINIFNNNTFNNNAEIETCSICLNILDNNLTIYEMKDCKHRFHSNCLIEWLCTSNNCPLCRYVLQPNHMKTSMFTYITNFLRSKKNTNKNLINIYKKYKNTKEKLNNNKKAFKLFETKNKNIIKQYKKMLQEKRNLSWRLRINRRAILSLPITPIFIK